MCLSLVSYVSQYVSQFMTLLPGDIISTGTPAGVGLGMNPPQYLKAGDVVELGIDGLGESRQKVVPWQPAPLSSLISGKLARQLYLE
jgi:2,4-diketo-3-deoxy-L-fuconate hydrolase